ncbi:RNA helicase Mov10l1 [Psilocybe cubensis]|uniref:RNA helicase Mov10l1 n=1 Tax=Psilocybe cubensis TaxID=181762 RepID=A0ACB8GMR1_PSICU|nr:RNA helicase Mov10l1 [Psilocybe cubensis]KAH9477003.1 RNA helicase Mov10l1 [Psilocybe cubensis]
MAPLTYQRDPNGWFLPRHPNSMAQDLPNTPQHPPGLAIPPRPAPNMSEDLLSATAPLSEHSQIDDFWKGRLAPPPGYRSRPLLTPRREPPSTQLKDSPDKTRKLALPPELPPPASLLAKSPNMKPPTSPSVSPKSLKNDIKADKNPDALRLPVKPKTYIPEKYAEVFVPQYLLNIQNQIHPLKPLPPLPVFPSLKYLQSFLIPRLIDESLRTDRLALLHAPPIPTDAKPSPLTPTSYHAHWVEILRWELDAIARKKESIVLWQLNPKVEIWKDAEFVLSVPGIRENHPYLEIGDLVHLREVLEAEKRGSNRALEGRVVALRKREGLVHISSVPLKEHAQAFVTLTEDNIKTENGYAVFGPDDHFPFYFNVSFMTNSRPLCAMEAAVSAVAKILDADSGLARQWLFPEPEDLLHAPLPPPCQDEIAESQWLDHGLNEEQKMAVCAVALNQSPIPHLISGPPGTGKTRTVVETVLQIFHRQPEACVLLCAPSNPATDTLALRLHKHLKQDEMLRLNDPNRTFAEVPDVIKPYCYVENDKFSLPPWKTLMRYRVVVCSCLDAGILAGAQCTNVKLMEMEEEVTASLHPFRTAKGKGRYVVQPHWTHLIIDEAAQGSEPELLIPISVVLPRPWDAGAGAGAGYTGEQVFIPQLALCGDINQLGPIVASEEARAAEFEVSLLERLFERPLYAQYERNACAFNDHGVKRRVPPYTTLVKNYRSHPVILMPPSAIFYNDSLQPFASIGTLAWARLRTPRLPLKVIGTDAAELSTDEKASWYNPGQIRIVVDVVLELLGLGEQSSSLGKSNGEVKVKVKGGGKSVGKSIPPLRAHEIGVMAPWRNQVWALRRELRNKGLSAVDVGTVEDYQGRENRVIIISCVRSSARFLEDDHRKGMGLIFERKRMNVAITRAKDLLVVIGNGSLLQRDPYWKSFLQFALRHGLYEGPELSLEMDGNYISRLESKLLHSAMDASEMDPEEQGLLLAGGVAREILRE